MHLRRLAGCGDEVHVEVDSPVTQRTVIDSLERIYPMLRGTIRDYETSSRRPFLRFFADGVDISLESPDEMLPKSVVDGVEPFMIIGAIAGGC